MSISIVGILVALVLICLVIWGTQRLLTAFEVQQPIATLVFVVVVVVCVLIALQALGLWGPWGTVTIR